MPLRNPFVVAGLSVTLAVVSPQLTAAGQAYLVAVDAEVAEFETGSFDLPPSSPWVAAVKKSSGPDVVNADSGGLEEFNKFLRKKMPGTYIQYNKLPYSTKKQIHADYVKTGDLKKTKAAILDTLKHH